MIAHVYGMIARANTGGGSMRMKLRAAIAVGAIALFGGGATAALALDPGVESKNFSKTQERSSIFSTPEYQAQLRQIGLQNRAEATQAQANDPERNFYAHVCTAPEDGC